MNMTNLRHCVPIWLLGRQRDVPFSVPLTQCWVKLFHSFPAETPRIYGVTELIRKIIHKTPSFSSRFGMVPMAPAWQLLIIIIARTNTLALCRPLWGVRNAQSTVTSMTTRLKEPPGWVWHRAIVAFCFLTLPCGKVSPDGTECCASLSDNQSAFQCLMACFEAQPLGMSNVGLFFWEGRTVVSGYDYKSV